MKKTAKVRELRFLELREMVRGPGPLNRKPLNRQQRRQAARELQRQRRHEPV